jgi:hypothetical protein
MVTPAVWHTLGDAIDAFRSAVTMGVEGRVVLEHADELAAAASAALLAHSQARAPARDALDRLFAGFFESIAPTGNVRPSLADFMAWSQAHTGSRDDEPKAFPPIAVPTTFEPVASNFERLFSAGPSARFVQIAASANGIYALDLGGQVWSYREEGWRPLTEERIAAASVKPEPRPPRTLLGTGEERSDAQGIVSVELSAADPNLVIQIVEFVHGIRATPPLIRDAMQRLGGVRHRVRLSVERIEP